MVSRFRFAGLRVVVLATSVATACATNPAPRASTDSWLESLDATADEPASPRARSAPIGMSTRRGDALTLRKLSVHGVVSEPIAFTELAMTFVNPDPRAHTGVFHVDLPADARISRFAVKMGQRWVDAEVIARPRPRAARLDRATPTAVTQRGDTVRFEAVIPSIPAKGRQEVVLSYRQLRTHAEADYTVRLGGLERVDNLEGRLVIDGDSRGAAKVVRLDPERARREGGLTDWVVGLDGPTTTGVRSGDLVVARFKPVDHDHRDDFDGLMILFDTSASRALSYAHDLEALDGIVGSLRQRLGPDQPLRIVAFDQSAETIFEGTFGTFDEQAMGLLAERRPLGASNLHGALHYAGLSHDFRYSRALLVSDGMITAGTSDADRLRDQVAKLADVGVRRLDVLVESSECNERLLKSLATELDQNGLVLTGPRAPAAIADKLVRSVAEIDLEIPGARWHFPEHLDAVQADDEVIVYAEIEAGNELEIAVKESRHAGVETRTVPLGVGQDDLIRHASVEGKVGLLRKALVDAQGQPVLYRQRYWEQIVSLSVEQRLDNEFTSFRMLPADAPGARPEILVAGPRGIQILDRNVAPTVLEDDDPARSAPGVRITQRSLAPTVLRLLEGPTPDELVETRPMMGKRKIPILRPAADVAQVREALRNSVRVVVQDDLSEPALAPQTTSARSGAGFKPASGDAYEGNMLAVMNLLAWEHPREAHQMALAWRDEKPLDPVALVALGETFEAIDEPRSAARAYGSLVDLYPDRVDVRRYAGSRLERTGGAGLPLAVDTYRRARATRPDHPTGHRLYAYAMLRSGRVEQAFDVLEAAAKRGFPERFGNVTQLLAQDLSLVGSVWVAAHPDDAEPVQERLSVFGVGLETEVSTRMVLSWETGGNDVDLHVRDAWGNHAYYENPELPSGGALLGDVSGGYGPEVFIHRGAAPGPFEVQVLHYAVGPLGFGMGKLAVVHHDGKGGVVFDDRPFLVMRDRASVDLGEVRTPW